MPRFDQPIEPMTLGNMRELGVRSLDVSCWLCHHQAVLNADRWPDRVAVPTFGPCMVSPNCGIVGADARPRWSEQPPRGEPDRSAMAKLNDEELRALLFLARHPNGCTEAVLMAHGFPSQMLEDLVAAGLAKASLEEMKIARKRRKLLCFQITDAGRKAAADN